jgi:O-antigen ligase
VHEGFGFATDALNIPFERSIILMLTVLTVFFCYALLTFGAVLPSDWFALAIGWLVGIAGCLVFGVLKREQLSPALVILFVVAVLLLSFGQFKVAAGVLAAAWAYAATAGRTSPTLRFFHVLLFIGLAQALIGLFQFFISPGWIFGYVNQSYRVSGTLINRNHFAGLLEMLIPVAFALAYISSRRFGSAARAYLYLLASAFMGLALLFSVSRMGIFSFLTTAVFLTIVLQLRSTHRRKAVVLGLGLLALVLAGSLWIGVDAIVQRYAELAGEDALLKEGRVIVFRDAVRMIAANPLGVGAGKFQDRYRAFQTFHPDLLFEHAHNDYLETAAEWGIPAAAAFWSFIAFVLVRAVRLFRSSRSPERRGILLACIGAMFSILVHSLTDFNLQIPSNAMLFFTFVGISLASKPAADT